MSDFINEFFDGLAPDAVRNVVQRQTVAARVEQRRSLNVERLGNVTPNAGDLSSGTYWIREPSTGIIRGYFTATPLSQFPGFYLAFYDVSGFFQFGVNADDGSLAALGGSLLINSDGLSIEGLTLAQYFLASNAGNQRQAWLGMYLPQGASVPVWSIIFTGPDGSSLITNGDAEDGDLTGWTDADSAWEASATSPYDGGYSLKHLSDAEVFPGKLLQNVAVTEGNIYSFGFASRLESGILSPYVKLVWKTSAPAVILTDIIYGTHSSSWQFSQQSFTAPETAASVDIELYPGDPFNDCYFDAIILFEQGISTELRLLDHAIVSIVDGASTLLAGGTTVDIPMSADTFLDSNSPTLNRSTETEIYIGEWNAGTQTGRTWIIPDFSGIPAGKTFLTATLKLTPVIDLSSNARTVSAHRCLRDVVNDQATWNIWKTGNNWGTAGASNSTTDYDGAVVLGTMAVPASPTLNVTLEMSLDASELQKLYDGTFVNNGIVLFVDTQANDMIAYASREHGTAAYRPVITIKYF